ncbi:energy transducer TonB [Thalassotalea ponticola]|uniref:energy transducer TonB n=1 Tax=Thalassotalea ponticola TaxID=1523392 RepID=UPI0025B31658|nr:energy transducer TonB [Thalassotalea ponticola]MDN3651210.1 energy transducer TonB [Thalassotalea ponticola]
MKLYNLLLVSVLVGCANTAEPDLGEVSANAIDLTKEVAQTENYWAVKKRSYPQYPISAARDDISGCVEFSFTIVSGKAKNIKIIKSVPEKIFNTAAIKSLKQFRWEATKQNSSQTPVVTTLQLDFSTSPTQYVAECISS